MAELEWVATPVEKKALVKYKTFRINFRIQSTDRRVARWYMPTIKYVAYTTSERELGDYKSRNQLENETIAEVKKYCKHNGEVVMNWAIIEGK